MATLQKNTVLKKLLEHVEKQRVRAKLIDKPFELGIATNKRPSYIFEVIDEHYSALEDIGMKKYHWQDDALRSRIRIAGEDLWISISGIRNK